MSNYIADVMVHIDEALPPDERKALAGRLQSMDGVVSACERDDKPHLLTVVYDSETTDSKKIVDKIRTEGHQAELVGM